MACLHPLTAYRDASGTVTFDVNKAGSGALKGFPVACSQCKACRLVRARDWAIRIMHESQTHHFNSFITLTYSDEHLPHLGTLEVTHWQAFAKRIRSAEAHRAKRLGIQPTPFRFYHCGEYGDENRRPHYHACIFGMDWRLDRQKFKMHKGNQIWTSPTLTKAWGHGECYIGALTYNSAAYVARYVMKKINGPRAKEHYSVTDPSTGEVHQLKPEYATMSRRPGIGHEWFTRFGKTDVIPHDNVIMNGKEIRTPKYYDRLLEIQDPSALERCKLKRQKQAIPHRKNNTPERLAVREECLEAQERSRSPRTFS